MKIIHCHSLLFIIIHLCPYPTSAAQADPVLAALGEADADFAVLNDGYTEKSLEEARAHARLQELLKEYDSFGSSDAIAAVQEEVKTTLTFTH